MTEPITIVGRGNLKAEARTDKEGVTIRIQDTRRPCFWAELRITQEELRRLIAADGPSVN